MAMMHVIEELRADAEISRLAFVGLAIPEVIKAHRRLPLHDADEGQHLLVVIHLLSRFPEVAMVKGTG